MRVVADTNTVVSGLLWNGPPRQVIEAARQGTITLFTSLVLLAELDEVLQRGKFGPRLALAGLSARSLAMDFAALAVLVEPASLVQPVVSDPDDDAVIACARAAHADVIVSGDHHLLGLREDEGIRIMRAVDLLALLAQQASD